MNVMENIDQDTIREMGAWGDLLLMKDHCILSLKTVTI